MGETGVRRGASLNSRPTYWGRLSGGSNKGRAQIFTYENKRTSCAQCAAAHASASRTSHAARPRHSSYSRLRANMRAKRHFSSKKSHFHG